MKEKQIQTLLGKWITRQNLPNPICVELKFEKGKSFSFNKVADHQIIGLQKAKCGFYYKISDSPIFAGMETRFTSPKPFDFMWVKTDACYIAICFYSPRKYKKVFFIDVDNFVRLREMFLPKKSVTMDYLSNSDLVRQIISL